MFAVVALLSSFLIDIAECIAIEMNGINANMDPICANRLPVMASFND